MNELTIQRRVIRTMVVNETYFLDPDQTEDFLTRSEGTADDFIKELGLDPAYTEDEEYDAQIDPGFEPIVMIYDDEGEREVLYTPRRTVTRSHRSSAFDKFCADIDAAFGVS